MNKNNVEIAVLIPAYNEETSIAKVILGAQRYVDQVIVCDDGSKDMTYEITKALGVRVIRHEEQRGKGEALRTLAKEIMELSPDIIVTMDADGQHNPHEIPIIVKPIETGQSDIVVGSRYVEGANIDAPLYRRFGLRTINYLFNRVAGVSTKDTQSGFRAFSRDAFDFLIQSDSKGYGIESEQLVLAARNGLRVMEVPISIEYRNLANRSKKSPILHGADLVSTLLRLVVEESPLKYLGFPGMSLTGTGLAFGLYLLWKFNRIHYFSIPAAILSLGSSIAGMLFLIAAIILHGLKRITENINKSNRKTGDSS